MSPHAWACVVGFLAVAVAIAADLIWVAIMERP